MRLVTDESFANETTTAPLTAPDAAADTLWPREVDLILSAMEAGVNDAVVCRRQSVRRPHRVRAELSLFAHGPLVPPIVLYTRDVTPEGVGFITKERVTLGYNGMIKLVDPEGRVLSAQCGVYRCREAINGWYEGSLTFAVEQPSLA